MVKHVTVILLLLLITCNVVAQLYIGITGDLGNRINAIPNSNTWIHRPVTFSGSVTVNKNEEIVNGWCLRYGVSLGVMGYRIKASEADTFASDPHFYDIYSSYSILYTTGHFSIGKQFQLHRQKFFIFFGGGATHYFDFSNIQSGSNSGVWTGNSFETVFDYEMQLTSNTAKLFAEISGQIPLGNRINLGLQYRHHFKPATTGFYNFYHTRKPASGSLSVTQRAFSVVFLIRLGRICSANINTN